MNPKKCEDPWLEATSSRGARGWRPVPKGDRTRQAASRQYKLSVLRNATAHSGSATLP